MKPVGVGIIGCGNISPNYLRNIRNWPFLAVKAVADIIPERAHNRAQEFGIAKAGTNEVVLGDPEIEVVINLTPPKVHYEVAAQVIAAGKSVYNEKPLSTTREHAKELLAAAKKAKVLVGGAPDTFFGAGHQTARKLIDGGAIGKPVAATAFMLSHGTETWHPDPEFFYKPGGGPMLDMGPYYITDLVQLLGPVKKIAGISGVQIPERVITSQPKFGTKIAVETPDHVAGTMQMENGCIVTLVMSFAIHFGEQHPIVIYGTEGTLKVPDPNGFDGEVRLKKPGDKEWQCVPFAHTTGYGRSVGVADLACSLRRKRRKHRASGALCYGVLDAMIGFLDASAKGKTYVCKAKYERPAALPEGMALGTLDE